ncbi:MULTISPECIES: hypothetical protein [Stenotrophomonas]|uniref:hypothetical protein n=1 Tax=Stenotrophomonas TaxID=40323 RepID=UPI0022EA4822|nr:MULTISPECIES: hypothetical protein [Stenotrophomonas]MDA3307849.1 hypothetical protein [Stenotrophomonas sp. PI_27]WGS57417.1 hypothetical protein IAI57_01195 [Stenotrophomonas pavanii]
MSNSDATLFHATTSDLVAGNVITASSPTCYYLNVVAELERMRPPGLPSRSTCVFAADSAEAAARFLMSQPGVAQCDIKVYRVEMSVFHKAPLRLIHELHNRLRDEESITNLITEYWEPKAKWVFWEYFGPSFRVLETDIKWDLAKTYALGLKYDRDVERSKTL